MKGWWELGLCVVLVACVAIHGASASQRVLKVGPRTQFTTPSQAAAIAQDGDVIEIEAGIYERDAAVWRANNLTIRGIGGRAHLKAHGVSVEGKGTWVIKGNNTTVENIEFSGSKVADQNGAGIRQEGTGLIVRNCYFHDNQNGILTGKNLTSDIVIEHSEFERNGTGSGYTHNIYIGEVRAFTLRYSYSHDSIGGQIVKTRAHTNYILYNRLTDSSAGTSNYEIDLSNGGTSYIIGNIIYQSSSTTNSVILTHAPEGTTNPTQELYVVNNTFVNDRSSGIFIYIRGVLSALQIVNNIFVGKGGVVLNSGAASTPLNNLVSNNPGFIDRTHFNYRLTAGSQAIDAGRPPGTANGFDLTPVWQYRHPHDKEQRVVVGRAIDMGAYEFNPKSQGR